MKADDRIEKFCKYCEYAATLSDPDSMLCAKIGVVSASRGRNETTNTKIRRKANDTRTGRSKIQT